MFKKKKKNVLDTPLFAGSHQKLTGSILNSFSYVFWKSVQQFSSSSADKLMKRMQKQNRLGGGNNRYMYAGRWCGMIRSYYFHYLLENYVMCFFFFISQDYVNYRTLPLLLPQFTWMITDEVHYLWRILQLSTSSTLQMTQYWTCCVLQFLHVSDTSTDTHTYIMSSCQLLQLMGRTDFTLKSICGPSITWGGKKEKKNNNVMSGFHWCIQRHIMPFWSDNKHSSVWTSECKKVYKCNRRLEFRITVITKEVLVSGVTRRLHENRTEKTGNAGGITLMDCVYF